MAEIGRIDFLAIEERVVLIAKVARLAGEGNLLGEASAERVGTGDDQAVVDTWVANNKWFTSDSEMAAVADMASKRINREHPGLTAAQNLAEVTRYMQRRYPEKFAARPAPNGSPVESGNRQPLGRSSAAAKLPPEALAQAQAYIKKGLIKSVEEYAAAYND